MMERMRDGQAPADVVVETKAKDQLNQNDQTKRP